MHAPRRAIVLALAGITAFGLTTVIAAQKARKTIGLQPGGSVLVTTNQTINPIGLVRQIEGARPKDLALSPDGRTVAVLTQSSVVFYTVGGDPAGVVAVKPGPLGIAWAPDGRTLFTSGESGQVFRFVPDGAGWKADGEIRVADFEEAPMSEEEAAAGGLTNSPEGRQLVPIQRPSKVNPQVAGLAVSPDGKRLYAALSIRNAVAAIDLATGDTTGSVRTGVSPYRILLSRDGRTLYVANRGGRFPREGERAEDSAGTPVRVDRRTDAALAGSLSFVNTGNMTAGYIETGRQPSGMDLSPDGRTLYVAHSDDDTVALVDTSSRRVRARFSVRPPMDPVFGQMPTGVAASGDGRTLYVSCGGGNAVAVVDLPEPRVRGYLPGGWYPIAVAERGGKLIVASSKGFGSRFLNEQGNSNVHRTLATVQFIAPKDWSDLKTLTRRVATNNRWAAESPARPNQAIIPIPERVGEPSVFKHVVYIIKENHTYDQDMGDMPEGNGDPKLCSFGEEITPNQHALARQFVLLDNTYTSGTNSADGHQWTGSAITNAYQEQNYSSGARSYPFDGGDPLANSPKGFLWTSAVQQKKTVRVYGEFIDKPSIIDPETGRRPTWSEFWKDYKSGTNRMEVKADTSSLALKPLIHPRFIGFPSNVPDQWRADQYLADLERFEAEGKMPDLSILLLPNNHTSGTGPAWPTPRAMVADNDLALGRIVDALTHSRFWKETLILVIEDDSQFGLDHVDGHRTVAFCVSPYTKRGAVVSEMYNHTSVLRTIGLVLGLPAMTRFDRTATSMAACFTAKPDFSPYTHRPNRVPLDEMNKPVSALRGEDLRLALASAKLDLTDIDRADPQVMARAIWRSRHPERPFPVRFFNPSPEEDED